MNQEIAIFLNDQNSTASLLVAGTLKKYCKDESGWHITQEVQFDAVTAMSPIMIRERVKTIAEVLETCQVFVAEEVRGIALSFLEGIGIHVWEMTGTPEDFMEEVLEAEFAEEAADKAAASLEEAAAQKSSIPEPQETEIKGHYFMNLKEAMAGETSFTSKQILVPFLEKGDFSELEMICSHVPPWFENVAETYQFQMTTEVMSMSTYKVTLKK